VQPVVQVDGPELGLKTIPHRSGRVEQNLGIHPPAVRDPAAPGIAKGSQAREQVLR